MQSLVSVFLLPDLCDIVAGYAFPSAGQHVRVKEDMHLNYFRTSYWGGEVSLRSVLDQEHWHGYVRSEENGWKDWYFLVVSPFCAAFHVSEFVACDCHR